jgi:hypothetical protein
MLALLLALPTVALLIGYFIGRFAIRSAVAQGRLSAVIKTSIILMALLCFAAGMVRPASLFALLPYAGLCVAIGVGTSGVLSDHPRMAALSLGLRVLPLTLGVFVYAMYLGCSAGSCL